MHALQDKASDSRNDATPAALQEPFAQTLKWIGAITALLTLIFGVHQLSNLFTENHEKKLKIERTLAVANAQEHAGNFDEAWKTLASSDLTPTSAKLQAAELNLAMRWLETRLGPDQSRFDSTQLMPVLQAATANSKGQRAADLLAHLCWAEFLRTDNGNWEPQAQSYYVQALQLDPGNVYAHAMHAYWNMWTLEDATDALPRTLTKFADAKREFAQALATGRERLYVRRLQLNGFEYLRTAEGAKALMVTLNEMRNAHEQLPPESRSSLFRFYSDHLHPWFALYSNKPLPVIEIRQADREMLLNALTPADQLAVFTWLFDDPDFDQSRVQTREYFRSVLEESAGRPKDATATLMRAESSFPSSDDPHMPEMIAHELKRLTRPEPAK